MQQLTSAVNVVCHLIYGVIVNRHRHLVLRKHLIIQTQLAMA